MGASYRADMGASYRASMGVYCILYCILHCILHTALYTVLRTALYTAHCTVYCLLYCILHTYVPHPLLKIAFPDRGGVEEKYRDFKSPPINRSGQGGGG